MAYPKEYYDRAGKILDKRKENAEMKAQFQREKIENEIPEIGEISRSLSQIGMNISKIFFMSGDKKADIEKLKNESLALQSRRKKLLTEHGYENDALEVKYFCPACKDTGFVSGRRCKCLTELLKELERDDIRKIAPLDDCTFDSFDTRYYPDEPGENAVSPRIKAEKIKESCRRYAASFTLKSSSLMFMGGTGLGKTHLSLAIANAAINRGYNVLYGSAQNILGDLQNENFGRKVNLRYTEEAVLNADLLVLDDLGTEFRNSYTIACLYNIINSRLSAKLPTIISTNFTFDELEDIYDQRITSRISGEYKTLILVGNDIRYIK